MIYRASLLLLITVASANAQSADELPTWPVGESPRLAIGAIDGDGAAVFGRVNDAARLPDGGIVVLDGSAGELRYFDRDGAVRAVAGREGEGPGEFVAAWRLNVLPGDTVVVWDYRRLVLSYWTTAGEFIDERRSDNHYVPHEGDLLPDGSVVVPRYGNFEPPAAGTYRPPAVLMRYADGESAELRPFPYSEMLADDQSGLFMPFHSRSIIAAGGDPLRIVVADDTREPRVRVYDSSNELVQELDLHDTRQAVTREMWRTIRDSLRDVHSRPQAVDRDFANYGRPDLTPAFDDLHVDPHGRIWSIRVEGGSRIAVVHDDGRPIAEVEMPPLDQVFEIGEDYILGVRRGAFDVPFVQLYRYVDD